MEDRIFGTECEYGLFHELQSNTSAAGGTGKAMGERALLHHLKELSALLVLALKGEGRPLAGEFLGNGGRFYVDRGGHPEYATPECRTIEDIVAHEKAGDRTTQGLVEKARGLMAERDIPGNLYIFKNNMDLRGNSYGSHENYLIAPQAMEQIDIIIPFLVTRQIYTGAGTILPGDPPAGKKTSDIHFGLSQRADFIDHVFSDRTTQTRGIINTRKREIPLQGQNVRLHVILGDSNMSEYTLGLKLGTTALVLRLLEEGALEGVQRFSKPVKALKGISHSLTSTYEMEAGSGKFSALDVQQMYLERAHRFFSSRELSPMEKESLRNWEQILNAIGDLRLSGSNSVIEDDPGEVRRKVDWALKLWVLNRTQEKKGLSGSDPQLKQLDIRYHDLDPQTSVFERCQSLNLADRMVRDEMICHAQLNPPQDTRAWTRGMIIRETMNRNIEVIVENWESLKLVSKGKTPSPAHFFNRNRRLVNSMKIALKSPFHTGDPTIMDKVREFVRVWG